MRRSGKSIMCAAVLSAAIALGLAPRATAQNNGSISGAVFDVNGKPWTAIGVQAASDQGQKQETKTDNNGKFSFRNLRPGVYTVSVILPAPNPPYDIQTRVQGGQETPLDVNFKDIVTKQGAEAQAQVKKQEEEKQKFEGMKAHFTSGNAILEQERQAKAELAKATPDQRDALKQKVEDLSNQAAAEYQAAEKAASEKDPNMHLLWAKLGEAYDVAGRNEEAANAYQQAIAAKPDVPGYYNNLGNVLARAGKIDEAKAAYTKSAELDPPNAAQAWRNFGISLYNSNRLVEGIEPLKKATELDPKNAQAWYLLGACMVADPSIYKTVGDKVEVTPKPGTAEAYQKAIELDPNGPYGTQAKLGLEQLQQMTGGIVTKVGGKKKKS